MDTEMQVCHPFTKIGWQLVVAFHYDLEALLVYCLGHETVTDPFAVPVPITTD